MGKTKRSGNICCVPGCSVDSDLSKIKFYTFPTRSYNLEKRAKWINALKRLNADGSLWEPSSRSRICSQHFVGGEKSEHPHSPAYLPTIFPEKYYGKQKTTKTVQLKAQNRFARAMRRTQHSNGSIVEQTTPNNSRNEVSNGNMHNVMQQDSEDFIEMQVPRFNEASTQVDFLENDINSTQINMFCSIRDNGVICEAGTQTNITIKKSDKIILTSKKTAEVGCGTSIQYADKQVGPNSSGDNDSLLICQKGFHGFLSVKDEQDLIDLAGVSFSRFQLLMKAAGDCYNGSMSKNDMLLLFLMRMKLGLTYSSIGVLFGIHRSTVSRIFHAYLMYLAHSCKHLVQWPSKFVNEETMPEKFKKEYPNCRAIIDCTEFKVEEPPEISQRVFFYSHYKHAYTIKILVACSPGGEIIFVSKCFGGRTTDAQITNQSGFLNCIEHGDLIMADKGFPEITSALDSSGKKVVVVMPPFLQNGSFTADEVHETQKIASLRIHIERIMQRIKTYRITAKFPVSEFEYLNDIIFMACVLVNLQPTIIKISNNDKNT